MSRMEILEEASLGSLPLHEVTQRYGFAGLKDRFNLEIDQIAFDTDTRIVIDDALELAIMAHHGDTRGEHPYATHLLRVATRIPYHFRVYDPEIIVASLLHDTVEDHPERLIRGSSATVGGPEDRSAAVSFIAHRFSIGTAELVAAVTNPIFDPARDRHAQYRAHVESSLQDVPRARVIKLSDFIDNCTGLKYSEDPRRAMRLASKYLPLIPAMVAFAQAEDTPLGPYAREYIVERLRRGEALCQRLLRM